jgi:hypothetical protein
MPDPLDIGGAIVLLSDDLGSDISDDGDVINDNNTSDSSEEESDIDLGTSYV